MIKRVILVGGINRLTKEIIIKWTLMNIFNTLNANDILFIREIAEPLELSSCKNREIKVHNEYITSGCFCCTSKIDLENILNEYKNEDSINFIVLEIPITADLLSVRKIIETYFEKIEYYIFFTIELNEIMILLESFKDLIIRNTRFADFLVLFNYDNVHFKVPKMLDFELKGKQKLFLEILGYNIELFYDKINEIKFRKLIKEL
ncbi:MAG: hypothetical protein QW520_04810 [Methanomassiliicoccales archaeon]